MMLRLIKMANKHSIVFGKKKNQEDEGKGRAQCDDVEAKNKEENMKKHVGKIKDLGKLFVGGLSQSTTENELEAYFSRFGKVIDSNVRRFKSSGKSMGFGYVTFINSEDSNAALQIGVHILDGKLIELRPFDSQCYYEKLDTRVFLGGLPHNITEETLSQYFSRYGKIVEVVIPRDKNTKQNKAYGFLVFADQESAEKCRGEQFVFLGGRRIHLEKAKPRGWDQSKNSDSLSCGSVSETNTDEALEVTENEDPSEGEEYIHVSDRKFIETRSFGSETLQKKLNTRVFLGGLPHDITEKTLRQFFSKYGEIVEVVIPRDKNTKKNKGFGFLKFADQYAAEKCEADQFVFLDGRRIQIKKAEPRNQRYKSSDSLSWDRVSTSETNIYEAFVDEDEDDEEAQSDVSENEYLTIEKNSALKTLFENYFLEKLTSFDKMNENEARCSQDSKFTEIEKLLADVLSNKSADSVPNLMKFSSESEDETESDDDLPGSFPSDLSKAHVLNDKEASPNQKPLPLQIRNSEGFLMCSVCQWISPSGSMESFLAHCKTPLHKTKLKDRFPQVQTYEQLLKIDSKPNSDPEKPSGQTSAKAKRKNKVKNIKKGEKELQPSGSVSRVTTSKKNKEETNLVNKIKNLKPEACLDGNLKIHALVKGMASIQAFSKEELMCSLCHKKIPKASEFDSLLKNVSIHLQSKTHLKKFSGTENSPMGSPEATVTLICNEKENPKQNNPKVQEKKENKCHKGIEKNKACAVGKPQNVPKVINNPSKKKPIEKKQGNSPDSDTKFICLPCNVRCDSLDAFNVHVKLKSHSDNLACKNVKAEVSMANMGKCKGCKFYLCGSLYQINKHYSKCVEK